MRVSFFCLAKRKKPKKRLPRCRFLPSVLAPHLGGCGTRAFSTQTVLAAYPSAAQAEGAARGVKGQSQNHTNATVASFFSQVLKLRHSDTSNFLVMPYLALLLLFNLSLKL